MTLKVILKDLVTGEEKESLRDDLHATAYFEDGLCGCDCNRELNFAKDEADLLRMLGKRFCVGRNRFIVVRFEDPSGRTLQSTLDRWRDEANEGYPKQ